MIKTAHFLPTVNCHIEADEKKKHFFLGHGLLQITSHLSVQVLQANFWGYDYPAGMPRSYAL